MSNPLEFGTAFLSRCCENITKVYAYWDELRGDRRFPAGSDLDPLDIPQFLSGIILVDVVDGDGTDRPDYVYRLVGTREVDYRGSDPTGKRVADAYYGNTLQDTLDTYAAVVARGEPLYRGDPIPLDEYDQIQEERLFLPFSSDGERVDRILVYITERPIQVVQVPFDSLKTDPGEEL